MKVNESRNVEIIRRLTPRQTDVLRLLTLGYTRQQVAETLHISPFTVKNHLQMIYNRTAMNAFLLGVHGREIVDCMDRLNASESLESQRKHA